MQLKGILDSLESGVKRLQWSPTGTDWGDYYDEHNYTAAGLDHKKKIVASFLDQMQPTSVWDLGANTGLFSRLASDRGISTIAFDIDPGAVELNYQASCKNHENHILPLLSDLTNPSPAIGWENQERLSLVERGPVDAIFALALIHHLVISNNVPLERLAAFFHRLGRWLVIEFVPKNDSQVQKLLSSRQDIFIDYNLESFEAVFAKYFSIHRSEDIQNSQRRLYLMEKR
jgi:ribosomal protein L11 methylase PrmA